MRPIFSLFLALIAGCAVHGEPDSPPSLDYIRETFIPKREMGVDAFLQQHPEWDGRNTVIAVFDTGVDPAALDLQVTTTGERKLVDVIDASGSGDVAMQLSVDWPSEAPMEGLSGRTLVLPAGLAPADGRLRLGLKSAEDLFHRGVLRRIRERRDTTWQARLTQLRRELQEAREAAEAAGEREFENLPASERTLEQRDILAREAHLESLQAGYTRDGLNFIFDCVLWKEDGHFHVLVDTDADGDLAEETVLRPFGIAGEYGWFDDTVASNFAVQVYEEGETLSLVTVSGSHGTHVASIAAGHRPDQPARNGIAPGARVLSVKIGDIRTGGGSNMLGELRALARAAEHEVDLINHSWGGDSRLMDGREYYARMFANLVLDYGVTAVISAGNNGPTLSSLGSPGGETPEVIGVGAWFSADMARYLYNYVDEKRDMIYSFSSTGPGKDGDLGPDIIAPGGALASVAWDQLQGQDRYHGTSMSAPSASGVVAILKSAAKATGRSVNPFQIRAALMHSAALQPALDPWSQGAGLVQVGPAWETLAQLAAIPAYRYHYDISVSGNTFSDGEGIYIRSNAPILENQFYVRVKPVFPDGTPPAEKVEFFEEIVLRTDADWIDLPAILPLSASGDAFTPVIQDPTTPSDSTARFAMIEGVPARHPEAGPLFRIPVTIVRGTPLDPKSPERADINLEPQAIERRFFQIPEHHHILEIEVERPADSANASAYLVQVNGLDRVGAERDTAYFSLEPGEDTRLRFEVIPGSITEVAINQRRYSREPGILRVEMRTRGLRATPGLVHFAPGQTHRPIEVVAPDRDMDGKVSAALERAIYSLAPEEAVFGVADERSAYPSTADIPESRNIYSLALSYKMEVEEGFSVDPAQDPGIDLSEGTSWMLFEAVHESGKRLSSSMRGSIDLPAGATHFRVRLYSEYRERLETLADLPLLLSRKISDTGMNVYADDRDVFRGGPAETVNLAADTAYRWVLQAPALKSAREMKLRPHLLAGALKVEAEDFTWLEVPIALYVGAEPNPKPDRKPTIKAADDRTPEEQFRESLLEQKLDFVKANARKKTPADQHAVQAVLEELRLSAPDEARVFLEQARFQAAFSGFLDLEDAASAEEEEPAGDNTEAADADADAPAFSAPDPVSRDTVMANIRAARKRIDADAVALFFASEVKPEPDDKAALADYLRREQEMEGRRTLLRRSYLLEAAITLNAGLTDAARAALRRADRWGSAEKDLADEIELALYRRLGHHGLVLDTIQDRLEKTPLDPRLWQQRIAVYRELGWTRFADRDALLLQYWKASRGKE